MKRGVFLRNLAGGAVAATATVQLPWYKELWAKLFPPLIPVTPVADVLSIESLERAFLAMSDMRIVPTTLVVPPSLYLEASKIIHSAYRPMLMLEGFPDDYINPVHESVGIKVDSDEPDWRLE